MCGIVGGVTNKDITSLLLEGLNRLEYRGYDSSGLTVLSKNNTFDRARSVGKVINLKDNLQSRDSKIQGKPNGNKGKRKDTSRTIGSLARTRVVLSLCPDCRRKKRVP